MVNVMNIIFKIMTVVLMFFVLFSMFDIYATHKEVEERCNVLGYNDYYFEGGGFGGARTYHCAKVVSNEIIESTQIVLDR